MDDAATRGVKRIFLIASSAGLALCPALVAQSFSVDSTSCAARLAGPSPMPTRSPTDSNRGVVRTSADSSRSPAALILFAAASAREVTFAKQPEVRVRLCGGLDSVRVVERRNLPNPVVAGRTYRDVYVAVEIFGRVNADCLVAALTSAPRDSTGQRNACASLEIGGARTRPPEP
jgi:hypothetical protein